MIVTILAGLMMKIHHALVVNVMDVIMTVLVLTINGDNMDKPWCDECDATTRCINCNESCITHSDLTNCRCCPCCGCDDDCLCEQEKYD